MMATANTTFPLCRPSNGVWYRLNSTNGSFRRCSSESDGDIPVQGDYDGDCKTDQAVYRPSTASGIFCEARTAAFQYCNGEAQAIFRQSAIMTATSKKTSAVFRPSNGIWYVLRSSNNSFSGIQFGSNGDLPAPRYDAP